jgi:glycyl-tRNA synthetase beta subunit
MADRIDRAIEVTAPEYPPEFMREIQERLYDAKRRVAVEYGFSQEVVDHYWPPRRAKAATAVAAL